MSFPEWAPATLILEQERLKGEIANCRDLVNDDDGSDFSEFCPVDWNYEAEKSERLGKILFRLLTNYDMKAAWATLSKPGINPLYENRRDYLLWDCIKRALSDYERMSSIAQTHAEKRRSLLAIVTKTTALQKAISDHSIAANYSKRIMELHLSTQHVERQYELGNAVDESEWRMPGLTLSGDLEEARREESNEDYEEDEKRWKNRSLTDRLSFWARNAKETTLDTLLTLLSDCLQSEAEKSPEIKQPGRGDDAFKPFLLRRLSEYMFWLYGQPLSEAVAIIASAVLDLESPLTRDDVRPYIRGTGKKAAKTD